MNKTAIALVAGTAMMGGVLAQNALAQPPGYPFGPYGSYGPPGYGYQMQQNPGFQPFADDYSDVLADRFDWMEDRLDISAEQKDAWNHFKETVLKEMDAQGDLRKEFRKDRPDNPMEMDQRRITMMERRLAGMKAVAKAREELFKVLDAKQRDEAADLMTRHHRRGGYDWYWGY